MKYCFDMDETICLTPSSRKYEEAVPYTKVIKKINELYESGNHITIFTARGGTSGVNYRSTTLAQLFYWGVKFHRLIDQGKPDYDIFIDDKAITSSTWRKNEGLKIIGFVASAFDLLHAGHCLYLKEAKSVCDHLIAGLHYDPSKERAGKNKPIQSIIERETQLLSVKYVDEVIIYETENDLSELLKQIKPDIRVLGSDAKDKPITGEQYCGSIYYHERDHNWSSTNLRERIINA